MQYTQAQIDRANAVSLEDFLRAQGETLIKSGREYAAVMKLPEKQAKRIYARYYLGMTVNEIAEVEGVDPSRVRDSIRRGLKQLAKYF